MPNNSFLLRHNLLESARDINYFTIVPLEDGLTIGVSYSETYDIKYRINSTGTWKELKVGETTDIAYIGDVVQFKGHLNNNNTEDAVTFVCSTKYNVKGNLMSLLFNGYGCFIDDISEYSNAFSYLFYESETLIDASELELPAITLSEGCYSGMFSNCTSLVNAPKLPATTLAKGCYEGMFEGCTSLTTAPELPATTLAEMCYQNMFAGCDSLTTAPELPATKLADYCYNTIFAYCIGLTVAPELPATTLANYCYKDMFYNCSKLTTAPELSATTLASYCYQYMFQNCTGLTTAPELPATKLANGCYQNMFNGCTSLTTAPELSATTLASNCYESMFAGCSSLTSAPELPAETLASSCYYNMFYGCTGLTEAPELSATTLANYCYRGMFYGCSNLINVTNSLPATVLNGACYHSMFKDCSSLKTAPSIEATTVSWNSCEEMFAGCTSLTTSPILYAKKLANTCYRGMFQNCRKLNKITMLATDISATNCLTNWVSGVASTGILFKHHDMTTLPSGNSGIPSGWTVKDYFNDYLTIVSLEDDNTISFNKNISYSINNGPWINFGGNTIRNIKKNDKIRFKGSLTIDSTMNYFTVSKKFNAQGNVLSLIHSDGFANYDTMGNIRMSLFYNNSTLIEACDLLLPSKELPPYAFYAMFQNCTSLIAAPTLLADKLSNACYMTMFYNCNKLNYIKMLATDISASSCLSSWVKGVASTGTFVRHKDMTTLPTGDSGIPTNWDVQSA